MGDGGVECVRRGEGKGNEAGCGSGQGESDETCYRIYEWESRSKQIMAMTSTVLKEA